MPTPPPSTASTLPSSAAPHLDDPKNLDFGQYLGIVLVAAGVATYHWRVLRADSAARPHRPAAQPTATTVVAPKPPESATVGANADVLIPPGHRYTLVVTDATEDDIHQALSNLPPQAGYHLTATAESPTNSEPEGVSSRGPR